MMDSDEEWEESRSRQFSMTGFLFGNINKSGQLETDIFDEESKRHLTELAVLSGLENLAQELTENENNKDDEDEDYDEVTENTSADEEDLKDAAAIDYSDINELADEDPQDSVRQAMAAGPSRKADDSDDDDYDEDESTRSKDSLLMPPPAAPSSLPPHKEGEAAASDVLDSVKTSPDGMTGEDLPVIAPLSHIAPTIEEIASGLSLRKRLKWKVTDLFPEFRPGKVLRFYRLFGMNKNLLPQIWRGHKRRKKRHHQQTGTHKDETPAEPMQANRIDGWDYLFAPPPSKEECVTDDEDLTVAPMKTDSDTSDNKNKTKEARPKVASWRYGPAQYWWDKLGVPENGEGFDYGFKLKQKDEVPLEAEAPPTEETPPVPPTPIPRASDECFDMICQIEWEKDIIWDPDEAKEKCNPRAASIAGWIPTLTNRTASGYFSEKDDESMSFLSQNLTNTSNKKVVGPKLQDFDLDPKHRDQPEPEDEIKWYSIFPADNEELVYKCWEDDIIWDHTQMEKIPKPSELYLDPNDENIILSIPEDRNPNLRASPVKEKKEPRRSKVVLVKAGVTKADPKQHHESDEDEDKDPFNISNDEYYYPKNIGENKLRPSVSTNLQHSTPALELRQPYFPTHMGMLKLRYWHRPQFRRYQHGPLSNPGSHGVFPLVRRIKLKAKQREVERQASGGGEMFFMRTPEDLSGMDGDLVLFEYCEEYPPHIMNVGMATKISNYYKRKPGGENKPPTYMHGETVFTHNSPFLGQLNPGESIQALENNLFRAPVYPHRVPSSDFLVIRTRQKYFIRHVDHIYSVGQECPLMEVPGPNSKRSNIHIRDFLQVFIYRMFLKSHDTPRRLKMEDIKKAFPTHSESSIRKRLKLCADFKRTGMDSNWWVIKPDFRLPSEEEIRAMVSPEQCCAYYAMLASEQRLKDAGYGEKSFFAPDDDNEEDVQKIDDEVRTAPWNTTRAFISAMKGKCLLAVTGVADPSGCGEGFSYVKVPNKPVQTKQDETSAPQQMKRTVTGTDADLRRLNLRQAKQMLRDFGISEEDIKKLSRWEVIDVVRTYSTKQAKMGESDINKFARGNRFGIAEHHERYKEECQRIFELQNKVLGSDEVLSTDEESSSGGDDSEYEEMGKNIESILTNKKTTKELSHEREEMERRELQRMIMGEDSQNSKDKRNTTPTPGGKEDDVASVQSFGSTFTGRRLKIYRTFVDDNGREYTRVETVRRPEVVETYVRIRQTKDEKYIRQFALQDDKHIEELKKERRRIQEQLRRVKRSEEKMKEGKPVMPKIPKPSRKKEKPEREVKMKCGACGQLGHMRTNKECPMYDKKLRESQPSVTVAMTEEQEEELERELEEESQFQEDVLVKMEGTKIVLPKSVINYADKVRRKSLVLRFPKGQIPVRKKRAVDTEESLDYLKRRKQSINRRRTDPVVTLGTMLEAIMQNIKQLPYTTPFHTPVNPKQVPDYYRIVNRPMDLQTIRENIRCKRYHSRDDFVVDIQQIVDNSTVYNGAKSPLTMIAQNMLTLTRKKFAEKSDKFARLEKAINPLLDDDDQVAFSFILDNIVSAMRAVPDSWPFHYPVNPKQVQDYYKIIERPMDLESMRQNCQKHVYTSRYEFLEHVELVHENCVRYNGKESELTKIAASIVDVAKIELESNGEHLSQLEQDISNAREAAMELEEDALSLSGAPGTPLGEGGYEHAGDEDYVDVEGDENAFGDSMRESSILLDDLQITPENSEDEFNQADLEETEDGKDAFHYFEEKEEVANQDDDSQLENQLAISDDDEMEGVGEDEEEISQVMMGRDEFEDEGSFDFQNSERSGSRQSEGALEEESFEFSQDDNSRPDTGMDMEGSTRQEESDEDDDDEFEDVEDDEERSIFD